MIPNVQTRSIPVASLSTSAKAPLPHRSLLTGFRRQLRGVHLAYRFWLRLGGAPLLIARTNTGAQFALNPYDYIDGFVLREGFYESEVFEAIRSHLVADSVFWDIGANLGLHAVSAKVAVPTATVIAFEPNLPTAARLAANAALNAAEVSVAPIALGRATGWSRFYAPVGLDPGLARITRAPHAPEPRSTSVWCARADELVLSGHWPAPTVVKLDVEDSEADVLHGLGSLLARPTLQAIVFEGAPGLESVTATGPVIDPLRAAGFTLRRLVRREATEHFLVNYAAERL